MDYIFDRIHQYATETPSAPFLYDEEHPEGITYAEGDELSGRVYGWLKRQGIGREDFVLINLPRGIMPYIAMLGVWKAGAAFTAVDQSMPEARVRVISADCSCKIELNAGNWAEVISTPPLQGYEKAAPHDAAFALYTSGTTGRPKGVLHEYGNITRCRLSLRMPGDPIYRAGNHWASILPMNLIATISNFIGVLCADHASMYVVPAEAVKNPPLLRTLFEKYRFNIIFCSTAYTPVLASFLSDFLEIVVIGGEPAGNLHIPGIRLLNLYGPSDSLFMVGCFEIDRSYDMAPVGKTYFDLKKCLLDEDGNEVPEGALGELCYDNPYFRCYINRPEETRRVLRGGWFHSGDMAHRDDDGNYVILGRCDDMFKVNDFRVEPSEIEVVLKRILGVEWVAVKGFTESDGRSHVCAYTTEELTIDPDTLRRRLLGELPHYMIPTNYIKLDSIPRHPSGKMNRNALPDPLASDYRKPYTPPSTPTEEALCKAMQRILKLEKMGADDDFYELGGDSLSSITVMCDCGVEGLSTDDIFLGRTPRKIAARYEARRAAEADADRDQLTSEAMSRSWPLSPEQLYIYRCQMTDADATMFNLFALLRHDKSRLDAPTLVCALETVIRNHPALLTTIHRDENGELTQRYSPEVFTPVKVTSTTEAEMETLKDGLIRPFRLLNERLYRCEVFETEASLYLFIDIHHLLFDGYSTQVFQRDLLTVLGGGELRPDYYYLLLRSHRLAEGSKAYEESRRYYEDRYDNTEWSRYPTPDRLDEGDELNSLEIPFSADFTGFGAAEKKFGVSRNEMLITTALLAVALYNDCSDVKTSWIFNGRTDSRMMDMVGPLFRELPVAVRLETVPYLADLFENVHNQVIGAMQHLDYPYEVIDAAPHREENVCVLYQLGVYELMSSETIHPENVDLKWNGKASQSLLDIELMDDEQSGSLEINYTADNYDDDSIRRFARLLLMTAKAVSESDPDRGLTELLSDIRAQAHAMPEDF
ncbi:MAG: AMP-binding protein [Oscillospiraceae bacterium]|nr:AMP-binding protein [Oscillospiraceae bacterium]